MFDISIGGAHVIFVLCHHQKACIVTLRVSVVILRTDVLQYAKNLTSFFKLCSPASENHMTKLAKVL